MKLKYKLLCGAIGLTILLVATQCAMQFISSYKFVGFARKDESTWIGIAGIAQADKLSCLQEVEELKKARDEANADIMQ